jgi:nucleoside phosphorylase
MAAKSVPASKFADYSVGWICALPVEFAAARAMLDADHGVPVSRGAADRNTYFLGSVGVHNVVIACLPAGGHGATPAATVAVDMQHTFRHVRIGLLVGVGSGVPSEDYDIRLGDVVVSRPTDDTGGVIQYLREQRGALGKRKRKPTSEIGGGRRGGNSIFSSSGISSGSSSGSSGSSFQFVRKSCLNSPPRVLLTAMAGLEAEHMLAGSRVCNILGEAVRKYPRLKTQFAPPVARGGGGDTPDEADRLYDAQYVHDIWNNGGSCGSCDRRRLVERPAREFNGPAVHYGVIASGDEDIECGITRDQAKEVLGASCFEREAAGIMNNFPCVVIRGVSDYADTHKNACWQGYAAATAAAFAKELLGLVSLQEVHETATIVEMMNNGKASLHA